MIDDLMLLYNTLLEEKRELEEDITYTESALEDSKLDHILRNELESDIRNDRFGISTIEVRIKKITDYLETQGIDIKKDTDYIKGTK